MVAHAMLLRSVVCVCVRARVCVCVLNTYTQLLLCCSLREAAG